ncbi:MAG: hypothetical protein F4X74_13175, partial [Acidimicrobiia bacterium]|nr:hypothetical protein [Acidimicrobiia bacterium]
MGSFEHKKLLAEITQRDFCPESGGDFEKWRSGMGHVRMLRRNAHEQGELIVAALSSTVFVHAALVNVDHPGLRDNEGLLKWNCTLFSQSALTRFRFESYEHEWGTKALSDGVPLVYGRCFEGLNEPEGTYLEVAQSYAHHLDIHWRAERGTYCRFDSRGDWDDVVSVTNGLSDEDVTLVSFSRDPLDQYLVEHDAVLVQLFEFEFRRPDSFPEWAGSTHVRHGMDRGLSFVQQFAKDGSIAAVRGVQIVRPRLSRQQVEQRHATSRWRLEAETGPPVEFTVCDFRNGRIATVTTDPAATTNYFVASENSLPYETSPAFFHPEVLAKYKADGDKYTVQENTIGCRGGWMLRDYGVNEAGQVFTYICRLRELPRDEQRHWAIYNEPPKTGISERAFTTDFLGTWPDTPTPREGLVYLLERWKRLGVAWWKWRPETPPDRQVVVPRMENRDEWGKSLVTLSNGVLEGFRTKELRRILKMYTTDVDKQWGSIVLLERILRARGVIDRDSTLESLRELNDGRRFSGVHVQGTDAKAYARTTLETHGTYQRHFEHLCVALANDLTLVESHLSQACRSQQRNPSVRGGKVLTGPLAFTQSELLCFGPKNRDNITTHRLEQGTPDATPPDTPTPYTADPTPT